MTRVVRNALFLAVFACFGSACASAPEAPGAGASSDASAPAGATVIQVENNLSSFADVTLYVEPLNGVRSSLGVVRSGTTQSFSYQGLGAFQLVAQSTTGQSITSERITLSDPGNVRWQLNTNRVTVGRR